MNSLCPIDRHTLTHSHIHTHNTLNQCCRAEAYAGKEDDLSRRLICICQQPPLSTLPAVAARLTFGISLAPDSLCGFSSLFLFCILCFLQFDLLQFFFFFVTNAKVLLCGAQLTASCLPHATNPVHFHMESSSNSTRRASLVTLQQTVSQKPIWCVLFCLRRNLCGFGGCGLTFLLFSLVGNFRPFYAQTHTHIQEMYVLLFLAVIVVVPSCCLPVHIFYISSCSCGFLQWSAKRLDVLHTCGRCGEIYSIQPFSLFIFVLFLFGS